MDNTARPLTEPFSSAIIFTSPQQWLPYALALILGYPLLIRILRYQRRDSLHEKYNYPTRESMAKMTDEEAYQIQKQVAQLEFPFMFIKSLQFALFRVRPVLPLSYRPRSFDRILSLTYRYIDIRHPLNLNPSN